MLDISDIKVLHLEPTTTCNASCPQCQRTIHSDRLIKTELSLSSVQKMFPEHFVKQLDKMFMCGNYGDPAAAKDTIKIYKWFKEVNPNIVLGMNTNGGVQNSSWWAELAKTFSGPEDAVIFSIDGLEDTNHIYRVNVLWKVLMRNINAFVNNGGNAQWDMLVFAHNEHQVHEAASLAKSLNMKWFRTKVTSRKINVNFLSLPSFSNALPEKSSLNIDCHALKEKSIYVDSEGYAFPCCFIGNKKLQSNFYNEYSVDVKNISLLTNSVHDVLSNFNHISDAWKHTPYAACKDHCAINNNTTTFENQWKNNIQF